MKSLVRALARRLGFEVRNIKGMPEDEVPAWVDLGGPWPTDDAIPGEWATNVLEMATHAHRPERLAYHRRRPGEDLRLKYAAFFLDLRGLRTLELGPYEGYWSVLLEKWGVVENVAVESRPENLAKCERIKELHRLDRTRFVAGDIEALASGAPPGFEGPFDLVFCLGLLYHLPEPARVLRWMRSQAPALFLGTHYDEPAESRRYLPENFRPAEFRDGDKVYQGREYREGGVSDPISGMSPTSFWPLEADLLAMIRDAGYRRVEVLGRDLLNRMPHITILAD
jgi:SAM-dependent methyltransferase